MLDKSFKCLFRAGLKIKLSNCSFFKEQIHYLGHLVSGTSFLPLANKIEALVKLKLPINIKEFRHFLGLTGYYWKFICNYTDIAYPLNSLTNNAQPFIWTPGCQASFHVLCLRLANTPIGQLPDQNKPYLLFTDASKFCYSGVVTQTSTAESIEYLLKILTCEAPISSVELQTQDLQIGSNVIHPVAYISDSFCQSKCRWPTMDKRMLKCIHVNKEIFILLTKCQPTGTSDQKPPLKNFTGHTDNEKCKILGL